MRAAVRALAAVAVIGGFFALWKATTRDATFDKMGTRMKTNKVRVVIDDAAVASATGTFMLIEPLWDRVDIYDSWARYESTLRPFTTSQRHLFAIEWYRAEVSNGGHDQFFSNSTGIVFEHALQGFQAIDLPEAHAILKAASDRIGGASRDRIQRESRLESTQANFEDLDERFYALEDSGALDQRMLAFAREHAADFRFEGLVERVVFPQSGDAGLPN